MRLLYPKERYDSIYEIDLKALKEKGIKGIITDLDNTLIPWRSYEISNDLTDWFNKIKNQSMKICIVSNAGGKRAEKMEKIIHVPIVAPAMKPFRDAFEKGKNILGLKANEIVVIGDQLFMDILGGNRAGMYTILVKPISTKEFIGTSLIRLIERCILFRHKKKNSDKGKVSADD